MTLGARRKARAAAAQMFYQMDMSGADADEAVELYRTYLITEDEEQAALEGVFCFKGKTDQDSLDFAEELVRGCAADLEQIDDRIRAVSKHWRLERMARVDRNLIRLATHELLAHPNIPRRVTLNEAIELAKHYGDEQSPSFVNGVLDRIAAELNKA